MGGSGVASLRRHDGLRAESQAHVHHELDRSPRRQGVHRESGPAMHLPAHQQARPPRRTDSRPCQPRPCVGRDRGRRAAHPGSRRLVRQRRPSTRHSGTPFTVCPLPVRTICETRDPGRRYGPCGRAGLRGTAGRRSPTAVRAVRISPHTAASARTGPGGRTSARAPPPRMPSPCSTISPEDWTASTWPRSARSISVSTRASSPCA